MKNNKALIIKKITMGVFMKNIFLIGLGVFAITSNTVNCMSVGSSTMCNDTKGNLLNINRW